MHYQCSVITGIVFLKHFIGILLFLGKFTANGSVPLKRSYYVFPRSLKSPGLTRLQCFMVLPCFLMAHEDYHLS